MRFLVEVLLLKTSSSKKSNGPCLISYFWLYVVFASLVSLRLASFHFLLALDFDCFSSKREKNSFRFASILPGDNERLILVKTHLGTCAGVLEESMGARNRARIGLSYLPARLCSLAESSLKC